MTPNKSPFSSYSKSSPVTICPCCGTRFAGDFSNGCVSCGARSVGEPLPKPERVLPSYGRALVLGVMGSVMLLTFLGQTIAALFQRIPVSFGFWSFMIAGQTAAWRLKWLVIPATLLVIIAGRRIYRSILLQPSSFCGAAHARRGLAASAAACFLVLFFIGFSVPARLRNRQVALEAAYNANIYRIDRKLLEYRIRHRNTVASTLDELPDSDGTLSEALKALGPLGPNAYRTSGADLAALPKQGPRRLRGAVIRNAAVDASDDDSLPLSFTNYELRLPGVDQIPGTDDDLIVRDGLITKVSEAGPGMIGSTASSSATKH